MADVYISQLSTVNSLSANNFIPVSDGTSTQKVGTYSFFGFRNRIINGGFSIDQRNMDTGTAVNNNAYNLDRWMTIASANLAVTVSKQTDQATGILNNIRLVNAINNTQKFGAVQYIESANCRDLRGKPVTLSLKFRNNGANFPTRVSLVEWSGTADVITTPIITDYSNAFPTYATGATVAAYTQIQPTNQNVWTDVILNATLTSSFNNLIVIFHQQNASASTARTIDVANVQLEEGSTATPFEFRPISTELALCQRYYQKATGICSSANSVVSITFPVQMRAVPNVNMTDLTGGSLTYSPSPSVDSFYFKYTVDDQCGYTASAEL